MSPPLALIRRNAFLVAAVALPAAVIALFVGATLISRRSVPPPAHDLVLTTFRPYDRPRTVVTDFFERDGRVHARLRAVATPYEQSWGLLLFNHQTATVREVRFDVPDAIEGQSTIVPVPSLSHLRITGEATAPDGYRLDNRSGRSGLVGDLFGMHRSRQRVTLMNMGRAVALDLPAPYQDAYAPSVQAVGWVIEDESR